MSKQKYFVQYSSLQQCFCNASTQQLVPLQLPKIKHCKKTFYARIVHPKNCEQTFLFGYSYVCSTKTLAKFRSVISEVWKAFFFFEKQFSQINIIKTNETVKITRVNNHSLELEAADMARIPFHKSTLDARWPWCHCFCRTVVQYEQGKKNKILNCRFQDSTDDFKKLCRFSSDAEQ